MVEKTGYDWKKTAVKIGWVLLSMLVAGAITMWQNDPKYMVLVPILLALQDYIKHRNG